MRKIILILICLLLSHIGLHGVSAEELSDAYMKEYTFLKAQKEELARRLKKEREQQNKELTATKKKVKHLQDQYVQLTKSLKEKETSIEKARETLQDTTSNEEIISNVINQAKMRLDEFGVSLDEKAESQLDTLTQVFDETKNLYQTLSSIRVKEGKYYLQDGTTVEGEIVVVGNIAAYGISTKVKGALAPAGNGEYKIWNKPGSDDDAQMLYNNQMPATLDIFVYENLDKDVEYQKDKTVEEVIEGGGVIGYVILGLGAFSLLMLLARVFFLLKAGSNVKKITRLVNAKIESGHGEEAYGSIKKFKGSTARVIRATLRNITREREHIEDIITENILNENRALDRFGSFILVIAAVAPLLGLLGTVTGMIHTFDIITIHGTGDPKLLSGGISEALVTTMLGLIVAIPLILLGNLSNGWAESIKSSMEQSALHVVNLFEKHTATP
jgi:biopolymer transport protein ExbB